MPYAETYQVPSDGVIYTANRIKAKGVSGNFQWEDGKGFGNAIDAIPSGGSGLSPSIPFVLKTHISDCIDTGYVANTNSCFELWAQYDTPTSNYQTLFGARNPSTPYNETDFHVKWSSTSDDIVIYFGQKKIQANWSSRIVDRKCKFVMYNSKVQATKLSGKVDYMEGSYDSGTVAFCNYPIYLGALNNGGQVNSGPIAKIYLFRIWENDTLVHEFVPWIDDNDVVCMKDTVTGNLKYNIGSGAFTFGTDTSLP